MAVEITKENFNEVVLNSDKPVMLDFWAEWCGPCKALLPVLNEVQDEMGSKVVIAKLNVDENQELAAQFSIRGIPTMIFFKAGEAVKTLVGSQSKHEIVKSLEELI